MLRHFSLLALVLPASVFASTVVYTDRQHPPVNVQPDTQVIYLDETEQLLRNMFGELASEPSLAERQARSVIDSADWPHRQGALVRAGQGLIQAWQLGLSKYPAVVFDAGDVVYGTADVRLAQRLRSEGGQP